LSSSDRATADDVAMIEKLERYVRVKVQRVEPRQIDGTMYLRLHLRGGGILALSANGGRLEVEDQSSIA
jgi:hypothetical protein